MKKDFYIYKCLKEIHRLFQEQLLDKKYHEILLILNTPGSLEHFMIHTDPDKIMNVFTKVLDYILSYTKRGSLEFGYKLGKEDQLSFYVSEPVEISFNAPDPENEFEAEAELISEMNNELAELGGRAWIEKNIIDGKTFRFTVNIRPPENQVSDTQDKIPFQNPDWSDRTILIVDDVHTNLRLLEGFLIPTKASVIGVDNGLKAVNAVKKNDLINFVLMDVRMPVLDGYEATRRIKRIKPWLPVVAISAYPGSAESENWKKAGCDAFLGKPLNSSELIRKMNELFEKVSMQI